ncbi:hypothetical protein LJR042_003679 [Microbacterium maritypicum]|uniref:DUF7507 domain-containing protein n=1 Tax=Microbacterium maritypicum TaxID=33918 RepID=UPI003ECDB77C
MFSATVARRWLAAALGLVIALGAALVVSPAVAAPTPQTCAYAAAGQGQFARTLCWIDMSDYSDAAAGTPSGQEMVVELPGGYTLSYTVQRSGRQMSSSPLPLIPSAFIGNGGHYGGVAGRPGLYQVNRAVDPSTSTTVRMTGISMRDVNGDPVHAFSIVGVDVEQTTTGETDTWTSNVPMTQIIPIGNACPGAFIGVGTTTVVCSANNALTRTGTAMLAAQDPQSMTQVMQNATQGVQGIAFAVLLPKVRLNKVVDGRIDPNDEFALSVQSSGGTTLSTGTTGPGATGTTGEVPTIGTTAGAPFTLAESSSPGSLSGYVTSWACTRNGQPDASLPSGQIGSSAVVSPAIGDLIDCTVTNTARVVALTLQKYAGTPVDANGNGITDPGDSIPYTFRLDNTGELPLEGIIVTDPLVGQVDCPSTTLAPGASMTCTSADDHVVTEADADRGAVLNDAVARGTPSGSSATITSNTSATNTPVTVPAPALELVKRASTQSVTRAGDGFTYAFDVTNSGNVTISGIAITEQLFTGTGPAPTLSCPATQLAPSAAMTCTTTQYDATQSDIDAGIISNTAIATGTAGAPVSSDPSSVDIVADQVAALELAKSATPNDVASFVVGQSIDYSFVVTNAGNLTIRDIAVDEQVFTGSGPIGPIDCGPEAAALEPGHQLACHTSYVLTQEDVDAGILKNSATAHGSLPDNDQMVSPESFVDLPADQAPALTLAKVADPTTATAAGQTIAYSFLVTNTGNVTLTAASITETAFSGTGAPPVITCPAEATVLLPGAAVTCTGSYVTTLADVTAATIGNTAIATATAPGGGTVDSPPSSATVTVEPIRSLSLQKSASPGQIDAPTDVVQYSFVVSNTGTVPLSDIRITETDFTGSGATPVVTCPTGAALLAPDDSVTCTATYTPTQADLDAGSFLNTATASGTAPAGGGVVTSDPSTAPVTVTAIPNLTVVKTSPVSSVSSVGDLIEYTFTVTNTGNVTLDGIRIREGVFTGVGPPSAPTCPNTPLAPGEDMVCTATVAVGQRDLDNGSVSNTAAAEGTPPADGDPTISPPSTVIIPAVSSPALTLVKAVEPTTAVGPGATQHYTFTITNTGNVTLSDVAVLEGAFTGTNAPPIAVCPAAAASLPPAGTVVCTATYTVSQTDADRGTVTNTATASGSAPAAEGPTESPESEAVFSVTVAPPPSGAALTLTKSVDPAALDTFTPGTTLHYRYVIVNSGPVAVSSIGVQELEFTGAGTTPTVSCPTTPATLDPGARVECSASYVLTAADANATNITNTAVATGQDGNGDRVVSTPSTAEVTLRSALPATGADPTAYVVIGAALAALGALTLLIAAAGRRRRQPMS